MPLSTTNTIILNVFDRWWRIKVRDYLDPGSLSIKPNIPATLIYQSNVIYNATTKTMIKNRYGNKSLDDAVVLRLWLNDELPVFEYKSHRDFMRQRARYFDKQLKSDQIEA